MYSFGPLSGQVDFQNCQQGALQRIVSQRTISQKDTSGITPNCLNMMKNKLFACFVCRKDHNPKNIIRITTIKMIKIAYKFTENIMQNSLNVFKQTFAKINNEI